MKAAISSMLFVLSILPLLGQSGGGDASLTGTVLDQAGKAVPSATVVVRNESATAARTVKTSDEGRFSVTGLPAGVYTIDVSAPGFAKGSRTGQQLSAGASEDISVALN